MAEPTTTIDATKSVAVYLDAMLELIPQEYYFRTEADPDQWKSKFSKNTRKSKSKQLAAHKQTKRAETRQQKKSKFDTAQAPSLLEYQG